MPEPFEEWYSYPNGCLNPGGLTDALHITEARVGKTLPFSQYQSLWRNWKFRTPDASWSGSFTLWARCAFCSPPDADNTSPCNKQADG